MATNLGKHFHNARRERGLTRADIARKVGYTNANKGIRRIQRFEEIGRVDGDLLERLSLVLDVDRETIERLSMQDLREWLHRHADPRPRYYKIGQKGPMPVPAHVSDEGAIFLAQREAVENKAPVRLILSPRITFLIGADGKVEEILEHAVPLPTLPVGGV